MWPEVPSDDISSALKDIKAVVGRSVGTTGRAGHARAAVGVLGHGSGNFEVGNPRFPLADGDMLMGICEDDDLDVEQG